MSVLASGMLAVPDATPYGVDGNFQMPPPTPPETMLEIAFDYNQNSKLISVFPCGVLTWKGVRARQGHQLPHLISAEAMRRMGLRVILNSKQEITWWSQGQTDRAKSIRCTVVPSIPEGIDLVFGTDSDDDQSETPAVTYAQATNAQAVLTQQVEPEMDDTPNSGILSRTKTACEIIRCAIREVMESDPSLTQPCLMERARVAAEVIRTPMEILLNKKGPSQGPKL